MGTRVLKNGVRPGRLRVSAVVTDQKILDGDPAAKLVAPDEDIELRIQFYFVGTRGIHQFDVSPFDVKGNLCFDSLNGGRSGSVVKRSL